MPPAFEALRAGKSSRVIVPARHAGWESIPGLLNMFTNSGSELYNTWTIPAAL